MTRGRLSRRRFLRSSSMAAAALAGTPIFDVALATSGGRLRASSAALPSGPPLREFDYADVSIASEPHHRQLQETLAVLMGLSDDSLLKPSRKMTGQPAPGEELGGWYLYDPNFDGRSLGPGFAPAATFGQWVSALARGYAINRDEKIRAKILRLNRAYAATISGDFYENNRFPAYCYDKLVCGLLDSHRLAHDPDAYRILEQTTDTALPHLPAKAVEHGQNWRPGKDATYTQDESYTIAENLFLAYEGGAGERYRALGARYLDDDYFLPLAAGRSNFEGRHAYSHVNALCSAMQAYLTLGSVTHLRAAENGFDFLAAQSFATGGWGADETLRAPGSDAMFASLTGSHNSFETPCGSYAHFKLTRYLLRVTRDARYGDSMERVMYNTVLGAKPLQPDGRTFYYSDYNFAGKKIYSDRRWPCCSGTLPQVAADYGINSYLRDERGVYVNLYIPSTLRWTQNHSQISLRQNSAYPLESRIHFEVTATRPADFAINFRIPSWARGASLAINGARTTAAVTPGHFTEIRREWKTGDQIDLDLPLQTRLEPIDPRHLDTVALLSGPLVLFAVTDSVPAVSRHQLLAAARISRDRWRVQTAAGTMEMLPFTSIGEQQYSTYLDVA